MTFDGIGAQLFQIRFSLAEIILIELGAKFGIQGQVPDYSEDNAKAPAWIKVHAGAFLERETDAVESYVSTRSLNFLWRNRFLTVVKTSKKLATMDFETISILSVINDRRQATCPLFTRL